MTVALRLLHRADGGVRALLRDDNLRLWLADLDDEGVHQVFRPAPLDRLVLFAEHAAVGSPQALQSPHAIPMLATLSLALVAIFDNDTNRRLFP
jgi:hypothetical protein